MRVLKNFRIDWNTTPNLLKNICLSRYWRYKMCALKCTRFWQKNVVREIKI